ncbi:MAG: YIP1 family protein, partial [Armatimonadota bacterium]|nr:YIP1 family protein [Armatimonadota bacterium]
GKGKGFAIALLVIIALTGIAVWGQVHLDGALDMHIMVGTSPAGLLIAESLIAWLSLGVFLFVASKIFKGNGGIGAHLAAAGLARFPYIIAAFVVSQPTFKKALMTAVKTARGEIIVRQSELMTPQILIGFLVIVGLVIWSIIMLYNGYRYASRIQGAKIGISFVIALIIAEVVSKALIIPAFTLFKGPQY